MRIFVVILNWNRPDDTIKCLESVYKLSVAGFQLLVVVVDNGSTDDSIDRIQKSKVIKQKLKFEIIRNRENLGFAGGNNVGLRHALDNGADYVLVLNNDTRVDPDLLIQMIEVAKKYPELGIASPKIYFEEGFEFHKKRYIKSDLGNILWYAGGEIDWDNVYGKTRGVDEVDKRQYDKIEETDFGTGTCMLINVKALERVGLFGEKYFMYFEDVDLSVRMKKKGWKVIYVPRARLWHKVAQSSRIGSNLNDYYITRNRLLFGYRYARIRTKLALFRESMRFVWSGRDTQKKGVVDFYLGRFGKGSWH